jgi:hypothetical protein
VRPGSSRPVAIELRDRQPLNPREFRIVDKRTAEVLSACYPTLRLIQNPPLRDLARRPDLRIRELSILVGNSFE